MCPLILPFLLSVLPSFQKITAGHRQHSCSWYRAPSGPITMYFLQTFTCFEMGPPLRLEEASVYYWLLPLYCGVACHWMTNQSFPVNCCWSSPADCLTNSSLFCPVYNISARIAQKTPLLCCSAIVAVELLRLYLLAEPLPCNGVTCHNIYNRQRSFVRLSQPIPSKSYVVGTTGKDKRCSLWRETLGKKLMLLLRSWVGVEANLFTPFLAP
jgi:hypothetical protein